jgi:hypothetical protein
MVRGRWQFAALVFIAVAAGRVARPGEARADEPAEVGTGEGQGEGGDEQVAVDADAYADTDPSALSDFGPTLDPHGSWVDDPTYGTIWTPNPEEVGSDFAPYVSAGHWAYDDGDVWESDYTWGWAAFHYGRWVFTRDRGWSWIPGRLYADAWVVWRVGEDASGYVGWSPMPPVWGWRDGIAGLLGFVSWEPFVFCPARQVFAGNVSQQVVSGEAATPLMNQTRPFVKASPVVGPRFSAPRGPAPSALGVDIARVPRPAATAAALVRARQFSRPSTAVAIGARPPVAHAVRPRLVARPIRIERPAVRPQPQRRK